MSVYVVEGFSLSLQIVVSVVIFIINIHDDSDEMKSKLIPHLIKNLQIWITSSKVSQSSGSIIPRRNAPKCIHQSLNQS